MQAHAHDLRVEIEQEMAHWGGGDPVEFVNRFVDDWAACPVGESWAMMLRYVEKLTGEPTGLVEPDIAALRGGGWSDAAIHDAVQVASYFNYINRVADALGVPPESGLPTYGTAG